jgi:hypothetical protein
MYGQIGTPVPSAGWKVEFANTLFMNDKETLTALRKCVPRGVSYGKFVRAFWSLMGGKVYGSRGVHRPRPPDSRFLPMLENSYSESMMRAEILCSEQIAGERGDGRRGFGHGAGKRLPTVGVSPRIGRKNG